MEQQVLQVTFDSAQETCADLISNGWTIQQLVAEGFNQPYGGSSGSRVLIIANRNPSNTRERIHEIIDEISRDNEYGKRTPESIVSRVRDRRKGVTPISSYEAEILTDDLGEHSWDDDLYADL